MWRDGGQGDATENRGEDVDEVRDQGVKGPAVEEEGSRWSRRQFSGKGLREEPRPVCVCEESWYFVSDQCARLLTPPSEMAIGKADPELRFQVQVLLPSEPFFFLPPSFHPSLSLSLPFLQPIEILKNSLISQAFTQQFTGWAKIYCPLLQPTIKVIDRLLGSEHMRRTTIALKKFLKYDLH